MTSLPLYNLLALIFFVLAFTFNEATQKILLWMTTELKGPIPPEPEKYNMSSQALSSRFIGSFVLAALWPVMLPAFLILAFRKK